MDRRDLLRGLLAMPIASTLGAGQHKAKGSSYPPRPAASGKLSVVVDGAFAIVVQKDRGSRIRIFTPREENDKHQFYFFDDPKRRDHKGPLRPQPTNRVYNFELSSEGLRTQTEPEIDTGLASFNVRTDEWCQKDYFVTIDLPVPKRITFTPPPAPVKFRHHDRHGCMPVNHVLEYDVTDQSKVRMMLGEDLIGPTPCAELIRRYQDECRKHGEERPGSVQHRFRGQRSQRRGVPEGGGRPGGGGGRLSGRQGGGENRAVGPRRTWRRPRDRGFDPVGDRRQVNSLSAAFCALLARRAGKRTAECPTRNGERRNEDAATVWTSDFCGSLFDILLFSS